MFVASVNGGIWRTTNGDRPFKEINDDGVNGVDDPLEQPDWEPLTDGDDTMRARSHKTSFWGPGFHMTLRGWETVQAYATEGYDLAKLHDTPGDHVVQAGDDWASLSTVVDGELDLLCAAYGFHFVKVYHSAGTDRSPDPGDDRLPHARQRRQLGIGITPVAVASLPPNQ